MIFPKWTGPMSNFGGPHDTGVSPSEGLALFSPGDERNPLYRDLFLSTQPPHTSGLARRLDPDQHYIACRWDYSQTPVNLLRRCRVKVTNVFTGESVSDVRPVDWGPNVRTGRVADLSPGLCSTLRLGTDDNVTVELLPPETDFDHPVHVVTQPVTLSSSKGSLSKGSKEPIEG